MLKFFFKKKIQAHARISPSCAHRRILSLLFFFPLLRYRVRGTAHVCVRGDPPLFLSPFFFLTCNSRVPSFLLLTVQRNRLRRYPAVILLPSFLTGQQPELPPFPLMGSFSSSPSATSLFRTQPGPAVPFFPDGHANKTPRRSFPHPPPPHKKVPSWRTGRKAVFPGRSLALFLFFFFRRGKPQRLLSRPAVFLSSPQLRTVFPP